MDSIFGKNTVFPCEEFINTSEKCSEEEKKTFFTNLMNALKYNANSPNATYTNYLTFMAIYSMFIEQETPLEINCLNLYKCKVSVDDLRFLVPGKFIRATELLLNNIDVKTIN